LSRTANLTFPVLSDRSTQTIRNFDLLISEKAADGHDVGGPGEFLLDSNGIVRWRKLSETHGPQLVEAAKILQ
jgi:peroxiredoxin